ncbi:MAG: PadR family transcriptional regulator [Fimbriiglobus sp.]
MAKPESDDSAVAKHDSDLRRGVLVLAVLSQLQTAQYGYSLREALAKSGMPIEEGTLYPLLRRLEASGLLASEWRIEEGPPRRYYTLSQAGEKHYRALTESWAELAKTMNRLLGHKKS